MRFVDKETSLDISELNEEGKVSVFMENTDPNSMECFFMELCEPELVRLRDWLNEAIEDLSELKT